MENNKYLPIGTSIAEKYEVVDVLGEDDFEILYLVRDLYRKGSFFVLKELFLETFSFREEQFVSTKVEARGVFNKRKKQIIEELKTQKINPKQAEIKTYGYEEDNDTVYTIMEFSSNASLEKYLQFTPKDKEPLPSLENLLKRDKKSLDLFFFFKILLIIGSILAVIFYAYEYFKKSNMENSLNKLETSTSLNAPSLQDRTKVKEDAVDTESLEESKVEVVPIVDESIDSSQKTIEEITPVVATPIVKDTEDKNITKVAFIEVLEVEKNISIISTEDINTTDTKKVLARVIKEVNSTITIKDFLDDYINASSSATVNDTLKYYDKRVKRYFKFKNATHKTIRKSQEHYNRKWFNRQFKIVSFKILKRYEKGSSNYFDLKTMTKWTIKNRKGKKLSGQSRGIMTIKEVENGFLIMSIK